MPADVIEVDFEARRFASQPLDERLDYFSEQIDVLQRACDRYAWVERQWDLERRRVGSLWRALCRERARNFPFTDEEVFGALRQTFVGVPVSATEIVQRLDARAPTHSARVRAGLALSRLERSGRAWKAVEPTSHRPARWAPAEADNA